jgi:tetratricopeptide (TPR) repeat protein
MVKSLTFFLELFVFCFLFSACQKREWYKEEFAVAEKKILAEQLLEGEGRYYQGSVPSQMILQEALQMNSENPDIWREVNAPFVKRGFAVENHNTFAKVVALAPELWQGWRGYLYLYFYRDYERAIADFNATDTLTPITDYPQGQSVDYMRGLAYYGLNENEKALHYFSLYVDEVTKRNGEEWVDVYAFLYRGLTYERLNRKGLAIIDFTTGNKYAGQMVDFPFHKARILIDEPNSNPGEIVKLFKVAKENFSKGYYHQRPYVEVHNQLYEEDIRELEKRISDVVVISKTR